MPKIEIHTENHEAECLGYCTVDGCRGHDTGVIAWVEIVVDGFAFSFETGEACNDKDLRAALAKLEALSDA